jgi:hypothetical protein
MKLPKTMNFDQADHHVQSLVGPGSVGMLSFLNGLLLWQSDRKDWFFPSSQQNTSSAAYALCATFASAMESAAPPSVLTNVVCCA